MGYAPRGMFNLLNTNFNFVNPNLIAMEGFLTAEDIVRLRKYSTNWNFYGGYHYEDIPQTDKPEVTENWCNKFVNKFVEAEMNPHYSIKLTEKAEPIVLPFLNEVWEDNAGERTLGEIGQMKSVTGDAYMHIIYEPKYINGVLNPDFYDPYDLYDKGRIKLVPIPSSICFPHFKDGYNMYDMDDCTIIFPVKQDNPTFGASTGTRYDIIRYRYTKDRMQVFRGKDVLVDIPNPYGIIPIVHFKNLSLAGAHFGISDLDNIIPLNVELNLKNSDVSEILDYHSHPVTAVFGARVTQLEKGANKVWGGLPKDAKIQNITLDSDLGASRDYKDGIRKSMFQIGSIPEIAMGGDIASNLSGISLNIAFMPLTDVVRSKWKCTKESIKNVNNIVIKIGVTEGLLDKKDLTNRELYTQEVISGELLPKDKVQELEQLQQELKMGLDSRKNAMKRLKKDNIEQLIEEIEEDREENPLVYGVVPVLVSAGQKLVNPENGEVIADNPAPEFPTDTPKGETSQLESKPVGKNADGNDIKINSGVTNKNNGKNK